MHWRSMVNPCEVSEIVSGVVRQFMVTQSKGGVYVGQVYSIRFLSTETVSGAVFVALVRSPF